MQKYVGIDIGGSFIKFGLVDADGNILEQESMPTKREDPEGLLAKLTAIIAGYQRKGIDKVAISLPGVISQDGTMITAGAIPGFKSRNIQAELTKMTGASVQVINDANAAALSEKWLGHGKNIKNYFCLTLGTGVGGAVVLNDQLLTGRTGAAGEVGISLLGRGNTRPVGYESVSFFAGAVAGLCRIYNFKKGVFNLADWQTDIPTILKEAKSGGGIAQESFNEFYQNVAVTILNITVMYDPERILIGGGVSANEEIMANVKQAVNYLFTRYTDVSAVGAPEILPCKFRNSAGILGAVYHYIQENKEEWKWVN